MKYRAWLRPLFVSTRGNLHQFGTGKEGKIRKKTTKKPKRDNSIKRLERMGEFIYDLSLTHRHCACPRVRPKCPSPYFGVAVLRKEEGQAPGADPLPTCRSCPRGAAAGAALIPSARSPEQCIASQPIQHHGHMICQKQTSEAPRLTY